jgi:hypothetical protein
LTSRFRFPYTADVQHPHEPLDNRSPHQYTVERIKRLSPAGVKRRLRAAGWTQAEVARRRQISAVAVGKTIRGVLQSRPTLEMICFLINNPRR